ncbi:MAG: FtsQ-type POTRA domain-containing protein [Candidatus Bipolaricaulota bacterium]|nr:FtsQ-type POTRA domain-containing protein [Candidatus Bipolaricaulota bacterium]
MRRLIIRASLVLALGTALVNLVPWQEYLAIREIAVKGGERIQAETVLQGFPIQIGMNWLTADIEAARQALLRLPDVRDAHVRRALWGRVLVTLVERQPLAVVQLGKKLFWMDTEGVLYQPAASVFGPVIVEPDVRETERGLRLADLFLLVPIRALMAISGNLLNHITTVRFEGSTMIVSLRHGPDVWLNAYDVQEALSRLRRVLRALAGRTLQRVDLRFDRAVVVSEKR